MSLPDEFGRTYQYKPRWEKDVERCPDRLPSSSRFELVDEGRTVMVQLEIKTDDGQLLGVLSMRWTLPDQRGAESPTAVSLFTKDELLFA